MTVVTITIRKSKSVDFKIGMLDAVHAALASVGVRQAELMQGLIEFGEENFLYDPRFPDVRTERTNDFVLVEIVLGNECGSAARQEILTNLAGQLNARGYNPDNVKVVFQDAPWENWLPAGDGTLEIATVGGLVPGVNPLSNKAMLDAADDDA